MNKPRKPLDEIMEQFDENKSSIPSRDRVEKVELEPAPSSDSLIVQLAKPKKKVTKIRFTLDLDKPLDDRLNKAAKHLNRHKSELARIALERLLDELEQAQ